MNPEVEGRGKNKKYVRVRANVKKKEESVKVVGYDINSS
jgi:hypothetical protein